MERRYWKPATTKTGRTTWCIETRNNVGEVTAGNHQRGFRRKWIHLFRILKTKEYSFRRSGHRALHLLSRRMYIQCNIDEPEAGRNKALWFPENSARLFFIWRVLFRRCHELLMVGHLTPAEPAEWTRMHWTVLKVKFQFNRTDRPYSVSAGIGHEVQCKMRTSSKVSRRNGHPGQRSFISLHHSDATRLRRQLALPRLWNVCNRGLLWRQYTGTEHREEAFPRRERTVHRGKRLDEQCQFPFIVIRPPVPAWYPTGRMGIGQPLLSLTDQNNAGRCQPLKQFVALPENHGRPWKANQLSELFPYPV